MRERAGRRSWHKYKRSQIFNFRAMNVVHSQAVVFPGLWLAQKSIRVIKDAKLNTSDSAKGWRDSIRMQARKPLMRAMPFKVVTEVNHLTETYSK